MQKNNYETPQAEIVFLAEDVIRTSGEGGSTSGENFLETDNYAPWIW